VDPDQAEGLALTLQQLQRINIASASGNGQMCLQQIKSLVGEDGSRCACGNWKQVDAVAPVADQVAGG